jgi:hypothetical protein
MRGMAQAGKTHERLNMSMSECMPLVRRTASPSVEKRVDQGLGQHSQRPDCWRCHYFRISWKPSTPYTCSLMGFSSRALPCIEVLRADGRLCQGFVPKQQGVAMA